MLSMSRSFQDHFGVNISSKSARWEENSDVISTNVLSRGERVKRTPLAYLYLGRPWVDSWRHFLPPLVKIIQILWRALCKFRVGVDYLMISISCTKQSIGILNFATHATLHLNPLLRLSLTRRSSRPYYCQWRMKTPLLEIVARLCLPFN